MMRFTSPHINIGMLHTGMEMWVETVSWENGSRVTKTGGLGDAYTSAKRSAMIYQRKYHYIY